MGQRRIYQTEADFWQLVQKGAGDECWPFLGPKNDRGYGMTRWELCNVRAHRLAFQLVKGPIPEGLSILHSCDNPPCCNPAHLTAGTTKENVQDAISKGRWSNRQGMNAGTSKLTDSQVKEIRTLHDGSRGSMARLAKQFNVCKSSVSQILRGVTWQHV